jgi:hypothetical protein
VDVGDDAAVGAPSGLGGVVLDEAVFDEGVGGGSRV